VTEKQRTIRAAITKARIAHCAKTHGWRLLSFRQRWDSNFDIRLEYQPKFVVVGRPPYRVELVAPLHQAYATAFAYMTGVSGIYWLNP